MCNRLKTYFIAIFFIVLIYPKNVLAQGTIIINDFPQTVSSNSEFNIGFSATGLEANTSYYAKSRLGKETADMTKGETLNETTQQWLNDGSAWAYFPVFGANDEGNLIAQLKVRLKLPPEAGEYYLVIRMHRVVSGTNFDSQSVNFIVIENITPTATNTPPPEPTTTPTPIPTPTLASKAIYQINTAKDDSGNELSSVNIYIDDVYIHHQDNEILTFCNSCHCDPDNNVDCNLGQHKISLKKDGYQDWSETKTFNAGDNNTVNPVLNKIVPTATPSPTITPSPTVTLSLTPTLAPTNKPTSTPTIVKEGEVLASSTGPSDASGPFVLGEQDTDLNLSNSEATEASEVKNNINYLFPASAGILGLGFIGFSVFSFVKSKDTKATEDKTVV